MMMMMMIGTRLTVSHAKLPCSKSESDEASSDSDFELKAATATGISLKR